MISFIIPTYKNDKSLLKCVDEILTIVTNLKLIYEIIVVDNFTTNQYVDKLFALKDSNVIILKNPVLGAHHSRRLGLYNSKGDTIIFVDDDNYLTVEYISFIASKASIKADFFIGCSTKEYVFIDWKKLKYSPLTYACGSLDGFEFHANIPVYWGAGMAMNRELGFKIFNKDLIVAGRKKEKKYIMSGEDHEYSLRAYFNKANFYYFSELGLFHDFDISRLNDDYYDKVQIGFAYAAYILKIYYDVHNSKIMYSNVFSAFLYNLMFVIGYNIKYPFQYQGRLLIADALNFYKFKNRFFLVNTVV